MRLRLGYPERRLSTGRSAGSHARRRYEAVAPASARVSPMEPLRTLWSDAGLVVIESREISVQRTFSGFDEFWRISQLGSGIGPGLQRCPMIGARRYKRAFARAIAV